MTGERFTRRGVAVDLFCGAGGFSLGAEAGGFDVRLAADVERQHAGVHAFNFPYGTAIATDLSKASGDELRRRGGLQATDIDALTLGRSPDSMLEAVFGGSPCQGFSTMGRRAIDDPRNALIFHFARLVHELGPRYAVLENVAGMLTKAFQPLVEDLIYTFDSYGYNVVTPLRTLMATDFGVPQLRERVFFLIYRRGERAPSYPEPTHSRSRDDMLLKPTPTVAEALDGLPDADMFEALWETDTVDATGHWGMPRSLYAATMRGTANDPDDLSYRRTWNPSLLTNSQRTRHDAKSIERFEATPHGANERVSRRHKLNPNGYSLTLRAGTGPEKGSFTAVMPIHPFKPRVVTVREAARLHGVSDVVQMSASKITAYRQLGNSVSPLVGRAIMHSIRNAAGLNPAQPSDILPAGDERWLKIRASDDITEFRAVA